MSKATAALGADTALAEFKAVGDDFGIGTTITDALTTLMNAMDKSGEKWADQTALGWYEDTPYQTENLKESIDFEANCPEYIVGVNLDLLLGPKQRPARRTPILGMIDIPDYDYTEEANKQAVSGYGKGFIEGLWWEVARREARKEFS